MYLYNAKKQLLLVTDSISSIKEHIEAQTGSRMSDIRFNVLIQGHFMVCLEHKFKSKEWANYKNELRKAS